MRRSNVPSGRNINSVGQGSSMGPPFQPNKRARFAESSNASGSNSSATDSSHSGVFSASINQGAASNSSTSFSSNAGSNSSASSNAAGNQRLQSPHADPSLLFDPTNYDSDTEDEDERNGQTNGGGNHQGNHHARGILQAESPTQLDRLDDFLQDIDNSAADVDVENSMVEEEEGEDDIQGEEDLDRDVPAVWDQPQDLQLDWEEDTFVDEVERMIQCIGEKKLIAALFDMSCTIVFDSVTTEMPVMAANDCYLAAAITFEDHLATFHLKAYSCDRLLAFLPGKTLLASYLAYVHKLKSKSPTAKALQSAAWAGIPVNQRKQILFGMLIKKKCRDTKAYVNMHLVPNYVPEEELPSGHTREQLLRAIRRTLWPLEATVRATNALRTAVSRNKKSGATALSAAQTEMIFEEAREKAFRKLSDNYYPPEFLVFLLFGVASQDPTQVLASLNGGNPTVRTIDPTNTAPTADLTAAAAQMSPSAAIQQMRHGGREARRTAQRLAAEGRVNRAGRGGAGVAVCATPTSVHAAPMTVIHTHVMEAPMLDRRIAALEKLIIITNRRILDAAEKEGRIANYEEELVQLLEEQRRV